MRKFTLNPHKELIQGVILGLAFFALIAFGIDRFFLRQPVSSQAPVTPYIGYVSHDIPVIKPLEPSDINTTTLLNEINTFRKQNGEQPLMPDSRLNASALAKCNDMVAKNYWSHISPNGTQPWGFMIAQGVEYQKAGENLGEGYDGAEAIFYGWVDSPEHKANMLNPYFNLEGIAVCKSNSYSGRQGLPTLIIVQHFIES